MSTALVLIGLLALGQPDAGGLTTLPPAGPARPQDRWPGADNLIDKLAAEAIRSVKTKDALALPRLYRLWNFNQLVDRPEVLTKALTGMLASAPRSLFRDHATQLLAEQTLALGRLDEAKSLYDALGPIRKVGVIGPFDNSAGRGHEEIYGPERGEGFRPIRGKAGPVAWREVETTAHDGVLELGHLVHPGNEATAYVGFVLAVEAPEKVVLRIGSVDQLAVFVDGTKVHSADLRREARLDQDAIPLDLQTGRHVILIKSSWLGGDGRLFLRLTAAGGGAIDGVVTASDLAGLESALRGPMPPNVVPSWRPATVGDGLDALIDRLSGPKKAEALALRADLRAILDLYDSRELPSPPERDLVNAIQLAPSDPFLRFFFAHRAEGRDPNLAHEQLLEALAADPGFVPAMLSLADLAKTSGRVLEAKAHLDAARASDPTFVSAWLMRATLGFDDLVEGPIAVMLLRGAPGIERSAQGHLELARMSRSLGDLQTARKEAEKTLALDFDRHLARHLLIDLLLDAGETGRALSLLDESIMLRPFYAPLWLKKARLLAGASGRGQEALAVLARAALAFPSDPSIPTAEAELALWLGDRAGAVAALDRSLTLDPHQPDVRQHRRALSGERNELEDRYSIDASLLTKAPVSEDERHYGAIHLSDRTVVRLYGDGKSTRFRQVVFRLRNPRLRDALRTHRIDYSPSREEVEILSVERIRRTGEILKAAQIGDEGPRGKVGGMYIDQRFKTITFDDLEEGDLVHLRYRIDSIGSDIFGGFFGDMQPIQSQIPKLDLLYAVITPERLPIFWSGVRAGPPVREVKGGEAILRWEIPKLEALDIEPYSPPYPEIGALISISTYDRWETLGAWYAKLYSEQLALDDATKEAGRRAIAGATSEDEKIQRLYDYVVKNTRYVGIELGIHGWKPFPAAETHRRRYGDCKDKSTLLAAMLRDAGIDADLTLVRTSDRGQLPLDHATMWAFNHAITYVPSKKLFLDPTAEFSGSTELPPLDQGAMALIVEPTGGTRVVQLPQSDAPANLNVSRYVARLSPTTELELEGVERFFGARASALRQEFEEVELRRIQIERQLAQLFEGVQVTGVSFSDLSNLEAPVEYGYSATVPRYGRLEGERLIIPVALFQHQTANTYAQLATRMEDLYVPHPWATQNVIRYELPSGARIESLPDPVEIDTPHLSLRQSVRKVENGFETDDTVTLKSRIVPAKDYEAFREACLTVDRALSRKVVIKW